MLSVIVDARRDTGNLPALLAQLTSGAVDGIVREVLIVAGEGAGVEALCEEMGAERLSSLAAAAARAKSAQVLVLPADFRLRDGWIGALNHFLARGGGAALVTGFAEGLFGRKPYGVLIERERALGGHGADLHGLRRQLGLAPVRIG